MNSENVNADINKFNSTEVERFPEAKKFHDESFDEEDYKD